MVVAGVAHNIEVVWAVACMSYVVRVFYMNDLKTKEIWLQNPFYKLTELKGLSMVSMNRNLLQIRALSGSY